MAKNNKKSEIEKLKAEVERLKKELKKRKKYGLVWEEKPEEVVEMCKEKLPVLKEVKSKEIKSKPARAVRNGVSNGVNLLIEGDNYHALSVLNYTHAKKVDVIYIDPPYNTGNKDFIFNDKYVDSEDAYRHSKWLAFMEKRLKLAKNLLKDTGVIFISIDDNEMPQLKLLMDSPDLFGEKNFIVNFLRKSGIAPRHDAKYISIQHDYILCYGRNIGHTRLNMLYVGEDPSYNLIDRYEKERGKYKLNKLDRGTKSFSDSLVYPIKTPDGSVIYPGDGKEGWIWTWSKEKLKWGIKNDFIIFNKVNDKWRVYMKQYQFVDNKGDKIERKIPFSSLVLNFPNEQSNRELIAFFPGKRLFDYPKPTGLMKYLINICENKNAVVLDFMAGTGTTGQAVLELNKEDGGNRQFILCTNNENNICTDVCYPRVMKAIKGYTDLKGRKVEGLGGNLKYFKTDFVDAEPTDKNKIKLTQQATEMLCVKEGTFEKVLGPENVKIFKNSEHYTAIIFDQLAIPKFKEAIRDIKGKFSVYIFSLSDETFDEEFADIKQKVKLSPIPEAILRVYRRIFR